MRQLSARGHDVLFLERDVPWYSGNRDLPNPPYGRTELYTSLADLKDRFAADVREADMVILGSYVPEGVEVGEWVVATAHGATAFYDIDTPVTLAKLDAEDFEYLSPRLIPKYSLYLSFTGGITLERLEKRYGAQRACALYCSVDADLYTPVECGIKWDLGYLGTYSSDRQLALKKLMLDPAENWNEGRFIVAGPMYPETVNWPGNVQRVDHLPPADHSSFYCSQRFTLNITRADMVKAGYSPSVRIFEAAACGVPIISDWWQGLDAFFELDTEILISRSPQDTLRYLTEITDEERRRIGESARIRVLEEHTSAHRAEELEEHARKILGAIPAKAR